MLRVADKIRAWPILIVVAAISACPALLPGTDRAVDAGAFEARAPVVPDADTPSPITGGAVVDRPAVDAPVVIPPPMDAATDRGPPVRLDVGATVDRPAPIDRDPPDIGVLEADRNPPDCGGSGNGGQACCNHNRCNAGYVCRRQGGASTSACLRCGGNREVCCDGDQCDGHRDCQDGYCQQP